MARESWLNKRIEIRPRFLLLLLIPVAVFLFAFCRTGARIGELEEQVQRSQEQVLEAYAVTEEMERRIAFMDTDEYIEQEARRRYNLLGKDEIRFVLGEQNSENTEEMLRGKPYAAPAIAVDDGELIEVPVATAPPQGSN